MTVISKDLQVKNIDSAIQPNEL